MKNISLEVHFAISKLLIIAPPLLNSLLASTGIQLTVGADSADKITSLIVMGIGLVYSYWTHVQAKASVPASTVAAPTTPATK